MAKLQALVVGCNGQLGNELVRQLGDDCIPKPHDVLDVTDFKAVRELIRHVRPTVLINCAAETSISTCEKNRLQSWRLNADAVDNMVKSCALNGIPYMHISCDQVYGLDTFHRKPYTETDVPGPCNYYGMSKLAAEHAVLRLGQCMCPDYWKAGFKYWVIRTSMLYERPWRQHNNWVYQMYRFGETRKSTELSLPTDIFRSPTYAPHLATSLIWMLRHHKECVSGLYHVAAEGGPSLYEIGSILSLNSRNGIKLKMTDRNTYCKFNGREPLTMPEYTVLDSSKFNEISPIQIPNWQQGIEEFIAAVED
jgi:dTDP-4-dehydrorhamnose reductase